MAYAHVAFLAISMFFLCSVAISTDHVVGDDKGWTVDFNYTNWAQDKVFRVGDNLVFNYDSGKHNVFKVNGTLFKDCTFPPINEALSTGKDVIPLQTEGRKWYICGIKDHCEDRQMKLVIDVASSSSSSSAYSLVSSIYGVVLAAIVAIALLK